MPLAHLFDIGNVLITFDYPNGISRLAPHCSVPPEAIAPLVESFRDELESGALPPDDFIREVTGRLGFRGSADEFRRAFQDIFQLNDSMAGLVRELDAADTPLFLLSNTNAIHVPWFTSQYRVFDRFDGAVYSHEAGCLKPDRRIFEIAIDKFELVPGDTVYIDDLAVNVATASDLGFRAIRYAHTDHEGFLDEWRRITG